jgi:hypothetical protein
VIVQKFVEDWFLKRLHSFLKFKIPPHASKTTEALRNWPESEKDKVIIQKKLKLKQEKELELAAA